MRCGQILAILGLCLGLAGAACGQEAETGSPPEAQVLARYEAALLRSPFQASAFERVYQGYVAGEGLAAFIQKLEAMPENAAALVLLARIHARGFETAKALECLQRAQTAGESSPELSALLGDLHAETGKLAEAAAAFESALQGELTPERRYELCRALGNVYLRQGDRDKAISTWKLLIEQQPDDPFALRDLAEIYTSHLLWDEAAALYAHLAEVSAGNPYQRCLALRALGDARRSADKFPEAVAAYEQALDLVTEDNWLGSDLSTRLVNAYQDSATLEELMVYLRQRIEAQPANFSWRTLLAEAALRAGDYQTAVAELNTLLERDPGRVAAYKLLLQSYRAWEKPEELAATYERMIQQFPAEPDYLRQLGETYLQAGDPEKAKATWQRLTQDAPTPENWALLGGWLEQYEFPQEAIAIYRQAIQGKPERDWILGLAALEKDAGNGEEALRLWLSVLDPQSSTAADYQELAMLLRQQDYPEQAEGLFRKAIELAPENPDYPYELARHLMEQEKFEAAAPLFEQVLAAPEKTFLQQRAQQGLLQAYDALGVLEQKREELRAAVAAAPEDIEARTRLAELLVHDGDFPGAIEQYEACVKLAPADNVRLQALAQAYERERRFDDALNTYKTLVAQDATRAGGYHRKLLDLYMSRGEEENAIATAQQLVQQTPDDAELRESLATVYGRFQKPDMALQQMRHAVRLAPKEAKYYRQLASMLISQQSYGEAVEATRQMLAVAQEDAVRLDAVRMLSSLYAQQNREEELSTEFAERLRATPKKLSAYEELAAVWESFGQPARGVEIIESALEVVEDRKAVLQSLLGHAESAGNIEKVVSVYDQLIALAGVPTVYDLERLGRAQMALGKVELALETWKRIPELSPDDSKAHLSHYRLLSEQGFAEEALPSLEKALELDKFNFQLRFGYAQVLAENDRMPEALEQLRTILELEPELPAEKQPAPGGGPQGAPAYYPQPFYQGGYPYMQGFMPPGAYMGRRSWRGRSGFSGMYFGGPGGASFAQFRPQVLQTMAQFGQQMNQAEEVLKPFVDRVNAAPADMRAKEDLLLMYSALNKPAEALPVAEALFALRPEDEPLMFQLVSLYTQNNDQPKAIALLEAQVAIGDPQLERLGTQLAQLYGATGKKAEQDALIASLRTKFPENQQILYTIAQNAAANQDWPAVESAFAELAKLPNQNPRDLRVQLAQMARQSQQFDRARALWVEVLLDTSSAPGRYQPPRGGGNAVFLYNPDQMGQHLGSGGIQPLYNPQLSVSHEKINAIAELQRMSLESNVVEAVINEHLKGAVDALLKQDAVAAAPSLELPKLYLTLLFNEQEFEEAGSLLEQLKAKGIQDSELDNLDLYVLALKSQFDVLDQRYAELMPKLPQLQPQIRLARAEVALKRKDFDAAEREARALFQERPVQPQLQAFFSHYVQTDQKDRAVALCGEWLKSANRDTNTLSYAAQLFANAGKHEEARELAREAWEQVAPTGLMQLQGRAWGGRRGGGQLEMVFQQLLNVYQQSNEQEAFLTELKERAAAHPESLAYRRFLINAYQMTGRRDEALKEFEALAAARPNDVDIRLDLAQQLMESNRHNDARAIYEELLRTQPRRAREIGSYLVQLMQRAPSEETTELVRQAASQSQDPDALQQLAASLAQQNKHAEAVEVYRKLLAGNPDYAWVRMNLASSLVTLGKPEEALAELQPMLQANSPSRQFDPGTLQQILDIYDKAGRKDELRNAPAADSGLDPAYMILLRARIAMQEQRFDEAIALLDGLKGQEYAYALPQLRLEIAEARKDWPAAISILEQQFQQQGHVDFNRLGELYLKAEQPDKAVQIWLREAEQQGSWGMREALRRMVEHKLWPQAEAFYREQIAKPQQDEHVRREMNNTIIGAFFQEGLFKETVLEAVKSGEEKEVLESLRQAMYSGNINRGRMPQRYQELLEVLPGNRTLLLAYAQACEENNRPRQAAEILAQVLAGDPDNEEVRGRYVNMLQNGNRRAEMEALLEPWMAATPTADSTMRLVEVLGYSGSQEAIRRYHDEIIAKLPEEQALPLAARLAQSLAGAGYRDLALRALQANFERAGGQQEFEQYLNMLLGMGEMERARKLWTEQNAKYRVPPLTEGLGLLLYNAGEVDTLVESVMQSVQPGNDYMNRRLLGALMKLSSTLQTAEIIHRLIEKAEAADSGDTGVRLLLAGLQAETGHTDRALAIYEELLKAQPNLWEAQQARAELLISLGSEVTPVDGGQQDLNFWQNKIGRLAGEEKLEEARAEAAKLAGLDPGTLNTAPIDFNYTLANIYLQTREYDKALALAEKVYQERHQGYIASMLAQCFVALKRPTEGLALWEEFREREANNFQGFAQQLVKEGYFAEALPIFTELSEQNNSDYLVQDIALATLKTGGDYRAVFRKAEQESQSPESISYQYAEFLSKNTLVADALHAPDLGTDPTLMAALARVVERMDVEKEAALASEMSSALAAIANPRWELQQALGYLHARRGEHEAAAPYFRAVWESAEAEDYRRTDAVREILQNGPVSMVIELLPRLLEDYPHMALDNDAIIERIAASSERSAARAAFEQSPALGDAEKRFYLALLEYKAAPGEASAAPLRALAQEPGLPAGVLHRLARLCADQGWVAEARACYSAIVALEPASRSALAECVKYAILDQDHAGAVEYLKRMFPAEYQYIVQARSSILNAVSVEAIPAFREALHGVIREEAGRPGMEHLIMLSAELSQRTNAPQDVARVCATLGVDEGLLSRARLWEGLIEQWVGAGPEKLPEGIARMDGSIPAGYEAALMPGVALPAVPGSWRETVPQDLYGLVDVSRGLGLVDQDNSDSVAYFVAEIESPDERTVKFIHGSDDWVCLRLNGEIIRENYVGRDAMVDQDSFEGHLNAGRNRLVLKTGNKRGEWEFSLGVIEGGEGLTVVMPEVEAAAATQ